MRRAYFLFLVFMIAALALASGGAVAAQLPGPTAARIDSIAARALADTRAPSVSVAIVQDGKIVYEKAYGHARLEPAVDAAPGTRYSIGSVSKQFLAATILLLVQDGKLSLDDHVSRFLPDLTRADEVTIRQLLSHTSGYQDYYPQDYVPPFMKDPATAQKILDEWGKKPLDFDPGTRWQYSNTNYVIAGRIVEKVTGEPLFSVLSKRILQPLGMTSAIDLDDRPLAPPDAAGYTRFIFGPARVAPLEGRGWLYAAGELAMSAHDLALWDISLLKHTLLKTESLETMFTPARLRDGSQLDYALGVEVTNSGGHPKVSHSGAVAGFVSLNTVWPDQGVAIVAIANMDGSGSPWAISNQVAPLLLSAEEDDSQAGPALQQVKEIFSGLAEGKIDRSLLSPNANAFFTPQVLADGAASLKELGSPEIIRQTSSELRGGMIYRHFLVKFKNASFGLSTLTLPDGKLEQFLIQ